ncbi:putative inorganic phosphate cotransporter [Anthonomus grandis grandis]|uniref:putative inorganic phosphate cotransporter n=1 Tax=Anthonomus grandis grandis TaxID=2921223 RepID=UPI0021652D99|nr:putative inorganic phosphate cotransporter [Anthonomus grandis grandis]
MIGCNPLKCLCCCCKIPQRVVLAILLHLALQNSYNMRVALNLAINEMVEPPVVTNITDVACPMFQLNEKPRKGGKYPWPREAEARILYAFYGGYAISHVPFGYIADSYGARHVLGSSMIASVVLTIIFPICIQYGGEWTAFVLRFLIGIAQGAVLPAIASMVSRWIPDFERPFLGSLAYSGSNLGPILTYAFTGLIIEGTNDWRNAFYVWAGISGIYVILHYLYMFSFPNTHPFLLKEELTYLEETVVVAHRKKTPWTKILLCVPVWANIAGHSGHNYIFYMMATFLPTYMKDILRFNITENGMLSAIPFLCLWMGSLGIGALANCIINKGWISRYNFGRIFGTMGNWGSALIILGAVYAGCNRELVVSLFCIAMVFKSLYYMTMTNNINELSRNYGGIIFAINNGLNCMTAIIGGLIVGAVTKNRRLSEWRIVFWIMFGWAILSSIVYIIWSSSERQEFDFEEQETPKN